MWWQNALQAIGIAGSVLSAVGVYIALRQIRRTREAADAARLAIEATRLEISSNVLLADVTTCTRVVEEIKTLMRSRKYESALLRVTDLNALIIQLQSLSTAIGEKPDQRSREALTSLSVLRDLLEQKLDNDDIAVETAKVNAELSQIADRLGHWIGRKKFKPVGGGHDDSGCV